MSTIFSYRNGRPNSALFQKGGLDTPSFKIDFADGMPGGYTLGIVSYGAVNAEGTTVPTVISGITTSGTVVTVQLLTCGTSGDQPAIDGRRFQVYVLAHVATTTTILEFNTYLEIINPAYSPDS